MLAACVTSWTRTYTKPTTRCGTYGCSREVISSAESFTFTDARASLSKPVITASIIGATKLYHLDVWPAAVIPTGRLSQARSVAVARAARLSVSKRVRPRWRSDSETL